MAEKNTDRRVVFVKASDLELYRCRPIGSIDVLDIRDLRVGVIDGLLLDRDRDQPLFLVIRRESGSGSKRFLVPVGDAWFDDTERAVRIDMNLRNTPLFDPREFERMTPDEAAEYERRVFGLCCPEVLVHRDGMPDYSRLTSFSCPTWLRDPSPTSAAPGAERRK